MFFITILKCPTLVNSVLAISGRGKWTNKSLEYAMGKRTSSLKKSYRL
jgi:hypothetical protein